MNGDYELEDSESEHSNVTIAANSGLGFFSCRFNSNTYFFVAITSAVIRSLFKLYSSRQRSAFFLVFKEFDLIQECHSMDYIVSITADVYPVQSHAFGVSQSHNSSILICTVVGRCLGVFWEA